MKMAKESENYYRDQKTGKKAEWESSTVKSSLRMPEEVSESNLFLFCNSAADLPFHREVLSTYT